MELQSNSCGASRLPCSVVSFIDHEAAGGQYCHFASGAKVAKAGPGLCRAKLRFFADTAAFHHEVMGCVLWKLHRCANACCIPAGCSPFSGKHIIKIRQYATPLFFNRLMPLIKKKR